MDTSVGKSLNPEGLGAKTTTCIVALQPKVWGCVFQWVNEANCKTVYL